MQSDIKLLQSTSIKVLLGLASLIHQPQKYVYSGFLGFRVFPVQCMQTSKTYL
jgi:hypothetical protein